MATVREPNSSHPEPPHRQVDAAVGEELRPLVDRLYEQLCALLRVRSLRDPLGDLALELTSAQKHAVIALGIEQRPLSTSALAQRIDASLPATTGIVDRLERAGLVERLRDDNDRRLVLVALTENGRRTFDDAGEQMRVGMAWFLAALSPEDRATFLDVFARAVDVLAGRPPETKP
jgi:DNA-binding MarR family transcriptional regulator